MRLIQQDYRPSYATGEGGHYLFYRTFIKNYLSKIYQNYLTKISPVAQGIMHLKTVGVIFFSMTKD